MAKSSRRALRYATAADMPASMRALLPAEAAVKQSLTDAPAAPPRHARHEAGVMNKTEAAYDQQLALRKHAGEIAWYAFEKVKLRLAKATFLTIDFMVLLADGSLECHEVKGRKGDRYWVEEDAKIKLKVAAEMFPFRFLVVWPRKGGGWCSEVVGRE